MHWPLCRLCPAMPSWSSYHNGKSLRWAIFGRKNTQIADIATFTLDLHNDGWKELLEQCESVYVCQYWIWRRWVQQHGVSFFLAPKPPKTRAEVPNGKLFSFSHCVKGGNLQDLTVDRSRWEMIRRWTPLGWIYYLYTLSRLKPLKAAISQVSSIHHLYLPPIIPWPLKLPLGNFLICQPNWRHFASLTHRSAFSRNAYGPHFTSTAATLVGLWAKFGTVSCDVYGRSYGEGESDGRREADDWITSGLADDWITSGLDEITWWVTWFLCSWEAPVWRDFFLAITSDFNSSIVRTRYL